MLSPDGVITEPLGGAHRDREWTGCQLRAFVSCYLAIIKGIPRDQLIEQRLARFRQIGQLYEKQLAEM